MNSAEEVKNKIMKLIQKIKDKTSQKDTTLASAIDSLLYQTDDQNQVNFYGMLDRKIPIIESNFNQRIEDYVFYNSLNLESVILDKAVSVGNYTFKDCSSLKKVSLQNAKSIGREGFSGCHNLKEISIPSLQRLDLRSFLHCKNLLEINLLNVKTIPISAFEGCSSLKFINTLDLETIDSYAFWGCSNLINLTLRNPNQLVWLKGSRPFYNTPIEQGNGYIYVPKKFLQNYKDRQDWYNYREQIRPILD